MMTNIEKYYNKFNEDKRLLRRHGNVEFVTSMKYIHEYLGEDKNKKIIDIGAGTGRYSVALANEGYDVTAVELVKYNLGILKQKNSLVKAYHFLRIKGAWMLTEVRTTPLKENTNASFLSFYQQFASDSLFQLKSLNETVQFVGPDPDDDFNVMEGVITADTWEAFAPKLPAKSIYNIVYGKPEPEGNDKIFLLRGVANGLEMELRFKKVGGRWLLMKMTT